jgi:ABC-2 type transport system ATP-binding protein
MRARAAFGFVPDRPFLYDRLSARAFLDFVGALYDVAPAEGRARADALIARLDLEGVADDLIETYSHGMRQKVSVAAALLHDPPLLMLDEPLTDWTAWRPRARDLLRERPARPSGSWSRLHRSTSPSVCAIAS